MSVCLAEMFTVYFVSKDHKECMLTSANCPKTEAEADKIVVILQVFGQKTVSLTN